MLLLIYRKWRGWHGIIGFGVIDIYGSRSRLCCAMHWNCLLNKKFAMYLLTFWVQVCITFSRNGF
jgi:hypothetical protein